jgi:quinol monooxygenase YgiN
MAEIVLALYRPKPGREAELAALVDTHVAELRKLSLVTERAPIVARSRKDGTIVEAFEWASEEAIERAHRDPGVQAIWARFSECAEYPTLGQLAEASVTFPGFEPVRVAAQAAAPVKPKRAAKRARAVRRAAKSRDVGKKRPAKKRGK